MRKHDAYIRLIRSTVVVYAIGFGWSTCVLADEPASQPAPSDQSVQARAVPRTGGPGVLAPKTQWLILQGEQHKAGSGYALGRGSNNHVSARRASGGLLAAKADCSCVGGTGTCKIKIVDDTAYCFSTGSDPCKGGKCGWTELGIGGTTGEAIMRQTP